MSILQARLVVVGANVGLGFEAAKHFASMNQRGWFPGVAAKKRVRLPFKVSEQAVSASALTHVHYWTKFSKTEVESEKI
jgi:hypothetical protein